METVRFSVAITDDTETEGPETFGLFLSTLLNTTASVVITDTATVTISDDEAPAPLVGSETVAENVASGVVTVTVTLPGAAPSPFTVDVSTGGGTATAGSDYNRGHRPDAVVCRDDGRDAGVHGDDHERQPGRGA